MEKILVIDDDQSILEVLDRLLTYQGYRVTVAHNGVEGMELLNSEGRFGLVITDIRMPKADGNQVAKYLKSDQRMKETPIVGISGYPDDIKTDLFDSIVLKPFKNKDLIGLIDSLI